MRRTVAALMGIEFGGTYFCYQMSFDDAYGHVAPVHCLVAERIEKLIGKGVQQFGFLAGEAPYKREYFPCRQLEVSLRVWADSVSGQRVAMWENAVGLVRQIKRRLAGRV